MWPAALLANTPPIVVIQSATMRPGTTLMDVVYQVNDPDDATVRTRALAFVGGIRSFANVVRPVTFTEGTSANLGDSISTNSPHTLTWDVTADWNIQLAQVKFEVLAVDSNGLLPFQGITIPAAADKAELKINQVGLTDAQVLNALFWIYAAGNPNMELANGTLMGSAVSGVFQQKPVVAGATLGPQFAEPFLFKLLNITSADRDIMAYAESATRTPFPRDKRLTTNWPYAGTQFVFGWGRDDYGQNTPPVLYCDVKAIAAGNQFNLALKDDGTVVAWGNDMEGVVSGVPADLTEVTAIAASRSEGSPFCLGLRSNGTVVAWGSGWQGQTNVPAGLTGVTAVAAGDSHSLALKNNGTVVGWGNNVFSQLNTPSGLSGVTAIAANQNYSLALKSNGTVVAWGMGPTSVPSGLSGVTAIAAGREHCLALKSNGTVVGWPTGNSAVTTIPAGLAGVGAIAAGNGYSVAIKTDGTLVAWGANGYGQTALPTTFSGVAAVAAGPTHCLAFTTKAP